MFNWHYDTEPYLKLSIDDGVTEIRPSNTFMFIYPEIHEDADHIFHILEETETGYNGYRIWRAVIDNALGGDGFQDMCDELHEHGFEHIDDDEPAPDDIEAWEKHTSMLYTARPVISRIVQREMEDFESKEYYYLSEWAD